MQYKIMYLGQKPIGEKCFSLLVDKGLPNVKLGAVVTNVDAESGWWKSNAIAQYALQNQIPLVSNGKRNVEEIKRVIAENEINCIISVGHNWIIGKDILEMVGFQAFNLHLAKLPEYQGNFSYNHAILNGDERYGCTLHWMTEAVDEGDYVEMPSFAIEPRDTAYSLYEKSVELGLEMFSRFLDMLEEGVNIPRKKMTGKRCFYGRNSLDGKQQILNIGGMEEIDKKSRAFYFPPFEGAYFLIDGYKYHVIPE